MAKNTRIKAKLKKGVVTVKAIAYHPMLSHQEAKRAKKDFNWITYVTATVNGNIVYEVSTSQFLSKNPYMKFAFNADAVGAKEGDKIEIKWIDLKGGENVSSSKIK